MGRSEQSGKSMSGRAARTARSRWGTVVALLMLLGLGVAACGDDDEVAEDAPDTEEGEPGDEVDDDADAEDADTADGELDTIRLADQVGSEVDYAHVWVARDQGYFEEEGIKIERMTYGNGPEALLDYAGGNVDAVLAGLAPFMQSAAEGQEFVMLMSVTKDNAPLVGSTDYDSLADLDGAAVGTPGVGTVQDAVMRHMANQEGVEVETLQVGVTDFVPMIQRGELDAFIGWEPAMALAVVDNPDTLHYIEPVPPHLDSPESLELIVDPEMAENEREKVVGLVRAILRGIEFLEEDPEEAQSIIAGMMDHPEAEEVVELAWDNVVLTDPYVDMESTELVLQSAAAGGRLDEALVEDVEGWMNDYLDYSFLEEAQESL